MNFKQHIEKYIQENGLQAKMTERKITIDDVCKYIVHRASKEERIGNCAPIDSQTVFGWAVHYIEDAYKEKEKVQEVKAEVKTEADPRPEEPKKPYEQLSLLDYMTEQLQKEKDK